MPKVYRPKRQPLDPCPLETVLAMVGGKWKARILYLLARRRLGFAALRREIGAVSQQVLATQLRALAADGLITRWAEADGSITYTASDKGLDLIAILTPAADWGLRELAQQGHAWPPPPSMK